MISTYKLARVLSKKLYVLSMLKSNDQSKPTMAKVNTNKYYLNSMGV